MPRPLLADALIRALYEAAAESSPTAAAPHLAEARAIITATGYRRRDAALAALEAAIPPPPSPAPT